MTAFSTLHAPPLMCRSERCKAALAVALLSLLLFLHASTRALGWSGADAYTIVLLKSFDTDLSLQEQFYNSPVGTIFSVSRDGYRVLDASIEDRVRAEQQLPGSRSQSAAYPIDSTFSAGGAYQGIDSSGVPLPFRCRLSGEWTVWTKEDAMHGTGGVDAAALPPVLLHCRLPLPQNRTEVHVQQRRYIAQHAAAMSAALETWWHTTPPEHASRCLFGDGESSITGVERYYELCTTGTVSRVQHHRLRTLLQGSRNASDSGAPSVLDFLRQMHDSPSARNAILRSPRYHGVFEEVGRYHPRISKPRWSSEYLVWESWYPSQQPCAAHYTKLTPFATSPPIDVANASRSRRAVRPEDAYWKTVVRFRCPTQRLDDAAYKLSTWSVTEARQLCEYHVEVLSDLVCGWEQELDSFHVNPVPCVVLD